MNILIAEDDQMTQLLYQEIMQDWGYDCDIASNGLKAVEMSQQNKGQYDFCIMDINMPEMNGLEAARVIRKMGHFFPIIGCSSDDSLKEKCFKAGMDAFIEKPFHFDQLSSLVHQLNADKINSTASQDFFLLDKCTGIRCFL
ncbi:MAG: response regulator [Methylomarinum sp.]|nr:response regulator [Methylomarinum sp.]